MALPPDAYLHALKLRLRPPFDVSSAARGLILGHTILLWSGFDDKGGPSLVAQLSPAGSGTQIDGHAGPALGGRILLLLLFLAWLSFLIVAAIGGRPSIGGIAGLFAFMLFSALALGLNRWLGSDDPDRLVRYVADVAVPRRKAKARATPFNRPLKLIAGRSDRPRRATPQAVLQAFEDADDRVILEEGPQHYLQAGAGGDDYFIEKREGGHLAHFEAKRRDGASAGRKTFSLEEALAVFMAYGAGTAMPEWLEWAPMEMPPP